MVSKNSAILVFLLALLVMTAAACGGEDVDDPGGENGTPGEHEAGEITLTVSGSSVDAANGTTTGQADLSTSRVASSDSGPQTFSLILTPKSLALGTYNVGGTVDDSDHLDASASLYPNGDIFNPIDFRSSSDGSEGSMTITESTKNKVVGSFDITFIEFKPSQENKDLLDKVRFVGTFRATPATNP